MTSFPETLPALLADKRQRFGSRTALREKDLGVWEEVSWSEYYDHVKYCALGFLALGLQRGDKVAILGDNCREWLYADLAAQAAGGTAVGVYPTNPPKQVEYVLDHSDSVLVVVRDQEQTDKVLEVKASLPKLKKIIVMDMKGLRHYRDPDTLSFSDLEALGKERDKATPGIFEELLGRIRPEDVALMVYTSGTTGVIAGCSAVYSHPAALLDWGFVGINYRPTITELQQAVLDYGPVVANVCTGPAFQAYHGGIFGTDEKDYCAPDRINHSVVLVGWGSSGGSWGSSGGSVGLAASAYVSPYIARPQTVVVARATNSVSRPDARSALLTVSVPADARVYVNGKATSSTGSFRQYISPSLSQGGAYTYEVRVEATRVGQVVGQTQTVQLRAGETQNLAFNLDQSRAVETSLTLQVPQDAIVVLAGEATTATGAVRTYKTKTLTSGQAWPDYSIQVSVVRNGQLVTQEKTIRLIGGRQESLRFSFGDQQVAAR